MEGGEEFEALFAVGERSSFNAIFLKTMFKVDIFVMKDDPFSREEMERRKTVSIGGAEGDAVHVASAEDTILRKLVWHRKGGGVSERQWSDLVGVISVNGGNLDLDYLSRWARQLGLEEPLRKALRDGGIEDSSPRF